MRYITEEDFKQVCDSNALAVISQSSEENKTRAEAYAIEEISSYLRGRYDMPKAFEMQGNDRNALLVMYTTDIILYHLVAWLPKKIGFEIRETRYNAAIDWCVKVQNGKSSPELPTLVNDKGETTGGTVRTGGQKKNNYYW